MTTALVKRDSTLPVHVPKPCWHRYQEMSFCGGSLMLVHHEFPLLRETPKGVWLEVYWQPRFVLRDARKRFACPTKEEALESFHRRKQKQIQILEYQLKRAKAALLLKEDGERGWFIE